MKSLARSLVVLAALAGLGQIAFEYIFGRATHGIIGEAKAGSPREMREPGP